MAIIISEDGGKALKIDKTNVDFEDKLQEYISVNPEALPLYEIKEDKRLFVASREFATKSGPIDALAFDADGDIYVVETKLFKNPDKRTVVAQALDYGAALWTHFTDFRNFEEALNRDSNKKFNCTFRDKMIDFFSLSDQESNLCLETIRQNLKDGRIKFVILMDSIEERLKSLIQYINQNSNFDIYAVQLDFYRHDKFEIVIPRLYGGEIRKNQPPEKRAVLWTWETFCSAMQEENGRDAVYVSTRLRDWAQSIGLHVEWESRTRAGFNIVYKQGSDAGRLMTVTSDQSGGRVYISFPTSMEGLIFNDDQRKIEFLARINSISGICVSNGILKPGTSRSIILGSLKDEVAFKLFKDAYESFLGMTEQ